MKTRLCPQCQTYNLPDAWNCAQCGSTLGVNTLVDIQETKTCDYCGVENPLLVQTCLKCGHTFQEVEQTGLEGEEALQGISLPVIELQVPPLTRDAFVDAIFYMGFDEVRETRDWRKINEIMEIARTVQAGEWSEVLTLVERRLKKYPDLDVLYSWKGYALLQLGKTEEAQQTYFEGLQKARSKIFLCDRIADLEYERNDIRKAAAWWIRSCVLQLSEPSLLEHARPFMMLAYVADTLDETEIASQLFDLCDRIQQIRLNTQGVEKLVRITKEQRDAAVISAIRLFYQQYIVPRQQRKTDDAAVEAAQVNSKIQDKVDIWIEEIKTIGKFSNRPIFIWVGLNTIVAIVSLLLGNTDYFVPVWLGGQVLALLVTGVFYFASTKPRREKALRKLVDDIQSASDSAAAKSWVISALVSRMPGHPVCRSVVMALDSEEGKRALEKAKQSIQRPQRDKAAGTEIVYQEVQESGGVYRIDCPVCGRENEFVHISPDGKRILKTGMTAQISHPPNTWIIAIGLAAVGFMCGLVYFGNVALACSAGLAFVLIGGWFVRDIVASILASLLSRRETIPLLLVGCESCKSQIPVASSGRIVLIGHYRSSSA